MLPAKFKWLHFSWATLYVIQCWETGVHSGVVQKYIALPWNLKAMNMIICIILKLIALNFVNIREF